MCYKNLWKVCICVTFKFVTRLPFEGICGYKARCLPLVKKHRIYTLSLELATVRTNMSACLIQNYVLWMSWARTAVLFADWIVTCANNEGADVSLRMRIILTLVLLSCIMTNKCVKELVGFINIFQIYPNISLKHFLVILRYYKMLGPTIKTCSTWWFWNKGRCVLLF
jgi:hypothetical protein